MREQPSRLVGRPLGLRFVRDLDEVSPEVRAAVLEGREVLSLRAARRSDT
jgi:hypothetical protein